LIPVIIGIIYGKVISDETKTKTKNDPDNDVRKVPDSTYFRIFSSAIISLLLIILIIWLIKPVPSQGWLRTLYAAILLSIQTPFVLLLTRRGFKKIAGSGLKSFYMLILIALPLGLLVHHPWNYFAFFSPFYWIAWAWMIGPQTEAVICGSIAMISSSAILFVMLKYILPRHSV